MFKKIKFIISGPSAGKTIDLGGYHFKDGGVTVTASAIDLANTPLPEANEHVGGDRFAKNLAAGIANITKYMERAANAFPEPEVAEGSPSRKVKNSPTSPAFGDRELEPWRALSSATPTERFQRTCSRNCPMNLPQPQARSRTTRATVNSNKRSAPVTTRR
jgi:hypothetical protein